MIVRKTRRLTKYEVFAFVIKKMLSVAGVVRCVATKVCGMTNQRKRLKRSALMSGRRRRIKFFDIVKKETLSKHYC